jgi:hypothetical protein
MEFHKTKCGIPWPKDGIFVKLNDFIKIFKIWNISYLKKKFFPTP